MNADGDGARARRELHSLHRYYIWAIQMRTNFDEVLTDAARRGQPIDLHSDEGIKAFMWMSYWYAALHVVIEGWDELELDDAEITRLLESPNVALLRRYRNGVFHFQRRYFDDRFVELIDEGQNVVLWVRALSNAFGRYFLQGLGV